MDEFIKALRVASDAMREMSNRWGELSQEDDDIVQGLKGWGEAFNLSLDEVPFVMWSIIDKLEELGGK
jgi:hypothetical protein